MRNLKRYLGAAVAAMAVVVVASDAAASCVPVNKKATTSLGPSGNNIYINAGADAVQASARYHYWQLGAYANANDTPDGATSGWFYFYLGDSSLGSILNNMGTYNNTGCPSGTLISTIEVQTSNGGAKFAAMTINEVTDPRGDFDYGRYGASIAMVPIPRPRVTSSSKATGVVTLNIAMDPVSSGAFGPSAASAVAGLELVRRTSTADPGRAATDWDTAIAGSTGAEGGPLTAQTDCTAVGASSQWYATRVVYADGRKSDLVSAGTRVNCDPALADPDRKFKVIERKGDKAPSRN